MASDGGAGVANGSGATDTTTTTATTSVHNEAFALPTKFVM